MELLSRLRLKYFDHWAKALQRLYDQVWEVGKAYLGLGFLRRPDKVSQAMIVGGLTVGVKAIWDNYRTQLEFICGNLGF